MAERRSEKISILMPAYNEGRHIYQNLRETQAVISQFCLDYEIVVADDGSQDNTPREIERAAREIPAVLPNPGGKLELLGQCGRGNHVNAVEEDEVAPARGRAVTARPELAVERGAPFADNAILQREMPVCIWGWSQPGTKVTVEFAGDVKTVEARDFWREVEVSPKNQGHHYNRDAQTYMEVGGALGWAMAGLLNWKKP